ncbi:DUF6447 family protein [Halomonas sp. 3F2F]|uniref:DUF6447 family protein n=1 Tax=Halomonas sp. 3F2F TaxID=1255602 RepID=UPI001D023E6D|nr:DUF6447 family protein [Halomonas sp. 3F2F]
MADKPRTLTIDGTEYNIADLSENARNQVLNLRATDEQIQRLNQQLAIAQTARTAYAPMRSRRNCQSKRRIKHVAYANCLSKKDAVGILSYGLSKTAECLVRYVR